MIGRIIDLALTVSGIGPALDAVQLVARLAFVAAVIVVAALVMGVDPAAVLEAARAALQDWLLPSGL
ncbi:hypothetical protein M0R89_11515 [Halorussus limi]|uniref:Uncharacterized protein n=1 Tax=Halorussus limi TaxID=2938695 RepID=A0A8U0HQ44_9EURY|nr:hypothetical protein [Halorussus limi]UPV73175.1 hypothetical protein M0R89_11515 [Halorussus limi]